MEGFDVHILHPDGRDVRGDMQGLPNYNKYERAAKTEITVADWRETRFKSVYPGFNVEVLDGDGEERMRRPRVLQRPEPERIEPQRTTPERPRDSSSRSGR